MSGREDDRLQSDRFYDEVDRNMRLAGAHTLARNDVFFRESRAAIACDVDWSELLRILDRIHGFDSWYSAWAESGVKFARLAREAEAAGRLVSAGEHFLRAAMLYHFAQLFTRPENPARIEARELRVAYFRAACPLLRPSIEPVSVPAGNLELPGYFSEPDYGGPSPGVLLLPGANSVKEELHHWAAAMRKRGLATLAIDGPGQGELSAASGGDPLRFENYCGIASSAVDWLRDHPSILGDQICIWGQSTGGQLAIRMAAELPGIKAVVSVGGCLDFRRELTAIAPADVREEARDLHGFDTFAETAAYVREWGSLDGVLERLEADLLLVHGARDELVANAEIDEIVAAAPGRAQTLIYPEGCHGVTNFNVEMTAAMTDWLEETLRPSHDGSKAALKEETK